ncbi:MAG: DUF2844 domain-containing protein [Rhodocyclales bacterium]|nr:DUF2844 domain-containing protein [Rhodocyclales bacterium]
MKTAHWLLVLLAASTDLHAELGGRPMRGDEPGPVGIEAMRQSTTPAGYSVQETETEDGTTVREYLLPTGEVFAVAWSGPRMPNLQRLLGAYFESYRDEAASRPPGRRPIAIDRSDLVVQSGGHPRAFHGRAYLPQRVPAGFSTNEIK